MFEWERWSLAAATHSWLSELRLRRVCHLVSRIVVAILGDSLAVTVLSDVYFVHCSCSGRLAFLLYEYTLPHAARYKALKRVHELTVSKLATSLFLFLTRRCVYHHMFVIWLHLVRFKNTIHMVLKVRWQLWLICRNDICIWVNSLEESQKRKRKENKAPLYLFCMANITKAHAGFK